MQNWKTTLGGAVSGLAAIFVGIEALRQGNIETGLSGIAMGLGLAFKGWNAKDK